MKLLDIERSIIKKYRKTLWSPFIKAVKEFELIKENDKIGVCISGGKDSLLCAKLIEQLHRHSIHNFDVEYMVMDPGYEKEFRATLEDTLDYLNIKAHIFDSEIFAVSEKISGDYPCYMCARMRRGFLYAKAKELGCNKIALGHHFNDVIETTMINMLFAGNYKTMKPKLKAQNFDDMYLIRPLFHIREKDIIKWRDYCGINALNCACSVTKKQEAYTRKYVKELIEKLGEEIKDVDKSIFRSAYNVNVDMVLGYKKDGEKHSFLEEFKE